MRDLKMIYVAILLSLSGMGAACLLLNIKAWMALMSSFGSLAPIVAFFFSVGLQALESAPLVYQELPELGGKLNEDKDEAGLKTYLRPKSKEGFRDEDVATFCRAMAFTVKILAQTIGDGINPFAPVPVPLLLALFGFELSFRGFLLARRRYLYLRLRD